MTENQSNGRHQPATAVHADERPWELLRWPGQWSKMLVPPDARQPTNPNAGLVRYEPGSHHPLHKHEFAQVWYILEGEFRIGERTYGPGTMLFYPGPALRGPAPHRHGRPHALRPVPGPDHGRPADLRGRFNMTARKRIEEENVEV